MMDTSKTKGAFLPKGASALIWHSDTGYSFAHAKCDPNDLVPQEVVCLAALMIQLRNPLFREEICESFEKAKPQ